MFILFSKLEHSPVIELENQRKLAVVSEIVIEPNDGKVLGLIIKVGQLLSKNQLVAAKDIVQILPAAVLVSNEDKITPIGDVIRVNELYKKKFSLCGQRVKTKSGRAIGRVNDFLIGDEAMSLAKIYVRHLLTDRIIPYSAIVKIDYKGITVKDDFEALSATTEAEAPAEAELA